MLTGRGEHQLHSLGTALRQRYVLDQGLIPANFSRSATYARSTDLDRTLQSAMSLLQGLYPPGTGLWSDGPGLPGALSLPPVHTVAKSQESLLLGGDTTVCPPVEAIDAAVNAQHAAEDAAEAARLAAPLASLSRAVGAEPPLTLAQAGVVADSLLCMRAHGRPWPAGVTDALYNASQAAHDWAVWQRYRSPTQQKLNGGLLLGMFLDRLTARAQNASQPGWQPSQYPAPHGASRLGPNLALYSAHDTTLYNILFAAGVFRQPEPNPPYASSVVMELVQMPGAESGSLSRWAVRMWYNRGVGTADSGGFPPPFHAANVVQVPGCEADNVGQGGDVLCPLSALLQLMQGRVWSQAQYDAQCAPATPTPAGAPTYPKWLQVTGPILAFVLGVLSMAGVWWAFLRRPSAPPPPASSPAVWEREALVSPA